MVEVEAAPPFKAGDFFVVMGELYNSSWNYFPLKIKTSLERRNDRWFYGRTDIVAERFRRPTLEDIYNWKRRIREEQARLEEELMVVSECEEQVKSCVE